MGGRHCFASCVLLPVFDPAEFAKTGSIMPATPTESPSHQSTPGSGSRRNLSLSPKKSSIGRRLSLTTTPPPSSLEDGVIKSAERPRKVGEVYFIYDDLKTLLLSVPFKRLDSGM